MTNLPDYSLNCTPLGPITITTTTNNNSNNNNKTERVRERENEKIDLNKIKNNNSDNNYFNANCQASCEQRRWLNFVVR